MENEKFEAHALIELFGHTRMAGKVTEQSLGGATFIRVDVPDTGQRPTFTRFLNPSAIYAINPVTEDMALHLAKDFDVAPISAWDIREIVKREKAKLEAPKDEDDVPVDERGWM